MPLQETDLQVAIVKWAKTQVPKYPQLLWLHSVPNGGKRDSREAQRLKDEGLTPGILDMALDVARGGYHGAKIELKKPGGKCPKASDEQEKYMEFCKQEGYATLLSNDFSEVKSFLIDYLEGRINRGADA